jgi:hypothetical protein
MTKVLLTAAVILFFASSLTPQEVEHAPTVAQCQADQALWLSKLEGPDPNSLGFPTLLAWEHEMIQCEAVDPSNLNKYYNTWAEAQASDSSRQFHFIKRHGFYDQFLAEDAAGKR